MADLVGWSFFAAFVAGIVWSVWQAGRAVLRRELRVFGISVTQARYPVSFWIGLSLQLVVTGSVAVFIASKVLIPTLASVLLRGMRLGN